jgi:hypothetical protein
MHEDGIRVIAGSTIECPSAGFRMLKKALESELAKPPQGSGTAGEPGTALSRNGSVAGVNRAW